jgi:hypothetical protein
MKKEIMGDESGGFVKFVKLRLRKEQQNRKCKFTWAPGNQT